MLLSSISHPGYSEPLAQRPIYEQCHFQYLWHPSLPLLRFQRSSVSRDVYCGDRGPQSLPGRFGKVNFYAGGRKGGLLSFLLLRDWDSCVTCQAVIPRQSREGVQLLKVCPIKHPTNLEQMEGER